MGEHRHAVASLWLGHAPSIGLAVGPRQLTLLETARMKNLLLNPKKIQFKSTDCKFFRHQLTPEGLKPDPEKIKAIVEMKAPQSIQTLQFQWHGQLL